MLDQMKYVLHFQDAVFPVPLNKGNTKNVGRI